MAITMTSPTVTPLAPQWLRDRSPRARYEELLDWADIADIDNSGGRGKPLRLRDPLPYWVAAIRQVVTGATAADLP